MPDLKVKGLDTGQYLLSRKGRLLKEASIVSTSTELLETVATGEGIVLDAQAVINMKMERANRPPDMRVLERALNPTIATKAP